ncbi:hypothetical protein OUZ56_013845 [Daphnia magna]|uniref:Uncharacterized protein n=2 Tax=Daphnia magna TaxID=35525 RepID=A0ABQ9Z739_9CRUS|nr:hypothetical protein OUZ56_013845 [Daphnia magna]
MYTLAIQAEVLIRPIFGVREVQSYYALMLCNVKCSASCATQVAGLELKRQTSTDGFFFISDSHHDELGFTVRSVLLYTTSSAV